MLELGSVLVTKIHDQIIEAGGNEEGMVEGKEVVVQYIDHYMIETEDGGFTVHPAPDGHSWQTFYTLKEEA